MNGDFGPCTGWHKTCLALYVSQHLVAELNVKSGTKCEALANVEH